MSIRILLADDHHLVRQGLRVLLEEEPNFVLIGEAADATEVGQLTDRVRPDVLLLGLTMPGINGLAALAQVVKSAPKTRVIILSMYSNEAYVFEALRDGAAGYVLKGSRADELILAIREVMAGRRYLSPPLTEKIVEVYRQRQSTGGVLLDLYDTLPTRGCEVINLVGQGRGNDAIEGQLCIRGRSVW